MHVLFLQGPSSWYFEQVARRLVARGHRVSRINLHFGDRLFWRLPADDYRGGIEGWQPYIARWLDANPITHLVLLGDQRPHHRIAIAEAGARGAEIVCAELGYFRPDWLVLERDGMSTHSRMPRDAATIRKLAQDYPEPDFTVRSRTPFWRFTALDMAYNLGASMFWPLYPGYRRHAIVHPVIEYLAWGRKLALGPIERRRSARGLEAVKSSTAPFFLLPLQLSTDYQIRAHSPYPDMETPAREVIASFAAHAPTGSRLVVKLHPLDPGLTPWRDLVERAAKAHGAENRVLFVDGGDLNAMLRTAAGCVTVNSTVGLEALKEGCPLKVLGNAVFDVAGLTFQGPLDAFWTNATPPDPALTADFIRLLAGAVHIRGGYYTQDALDIAVPATVDRLENGLPFLPPRVF
jgi:capsular polysaccharide export protein